MSETSRAPRSHYRLAVNSYDRTSSLLISLLVIVGVAVAGLVIVYFARKLIASQIAVPVTPVDPGGRPADAAMGLKRDLEPPGLEEVPELIEPKLQDTLTALTNAVTSKQSLLSDEAIDSEDQVGHGTGFGDNRRAGFGTGAGLPQPQRELLYGFSSAREYALWLDFFKIELGVLGRDNQVHYAYNLSKDVPDVRTGEPTKEGRFYMNATSGPAVGWNRHLAEKAGIAGHGTIILQFYPADVEAHLLELERQKANGKPPDQICRTVFRASRQDNDFVFGVDSVTLR